MRRFTKEHNELQWLFPICETEESASKMFDEVEDTGEYLFNNCYDSNVEVFSKDDMIDSFMKGYSVSTQMFSGRIHQAEAMSEADQKMNDKLWDMISSSSDKIMGLQNRIKELEEELNKYKNK